MTPKEFITKELGNFIQNFPQVRVRYEFHEMSNAHFVEMVPNEVYNLNEDYISWEVDMWNRFVKLFPEEGICFISDDALVGIKNVELTLYGENFTSVSAEKDAITMQESIVIKQQKSLLDRTTQITVSDSSCKSEVVSNLTITGNYPSYPQNEFSLAA
jgi:hypothetical protein